MEKGILVGCDQNQEWLLSWWWSHYCKHNQYPVVFVDFGMSKKALSWCKDRGETISLDQDCPLKELSPENQKIWEARLGTIWPFRAAWFKKPFAFLHFPLTYGCWIDLDCEVRSSLEPLFNYLASGIDIALVPEPEALQEKDLAQNLIFPGETTYNSGVIAFRKDAPVLSHWAKLSLEQNHHFIGDQNALSRAIFLDSPPMAELPVIYNWGKHQPLLPEAVILHYIGSAKIQIIEHLADQQRVAKPEK